ncbi:DUF2264 domain-containing protein [Streptomyces zhihengii]
MGPARRRRPRTGRALARGSPPPPAARQQLVAVPPDRRRLPRRSGHRDRGRGSGRRPGLAAIEQWYLGDGWYTDGRPRAFDHYNGWALHLLPVLHAHLTGDTALTAAYGDRLAAHLDGYASLFGGDGAPVHQGRSLSYRFGAAAAVWAAPSPAGPPDTRHHPPDRLRRTALLPRPGALDERGLLTLGWHGPWAPLVQPYSGPASPYWSACGFLGLLLPPDHPAWTATEEPAPAERADRVRALPGPGWLAQTTAADGVVRLHNHGSDDQPRDQVTPDEPLYAALAHSTVTGPTTDLPDNHFGLETGRRRPRRRGRRGRGRAAVSADAAGSSPSARARAGPRRPTGPGAAAGRSPASPSPR